MQRSDSSLDIRRSIQSDLVPATLPEFIQAVTPALQLCAPVGMSVEDRDTWFDAAYMVVGHLPPDILKSAALAAMASADHPSKIVPAIMRESAERMQWRQTAARYAAPPSNPEPPRIESHEERAKVAQTMGQLLKRMQANAPSVDSVLGKPA